MSDRQSTKVAVVGAGYWGRNLVRNFAELGALAAICDPDGQAAEALAARHGSTVAAFDTVLQDKSIAGVAIAAPAVLHASLARRALEAGKHVFVEKPLALKVDEAENLCALAEERDRRLMVGHLLQYHPAFIKLRELVRDGALGRLQYVYSNRLNLGKVRREEDILWSFAPHDLSMILSLVGQEPSDVTAQGGYYLHKAIADVTTTHMAFPNGEQAHVFVCWLHPFKEQKLVVVGERAMAVFDDGQAWEQKLLVYPHTIEWRQIGSGGAIPVPQRADADPVALQAGEPLKLECQHFLDCIDTGKRPLTDGREGVRVLRVLSRASEALSRAASASAGAPPAAAKEKPSFPGVFVHESAYVDAPCEIGAGTKLWHFVHILRGTRIGEDCSLGQNVMAGPDVTIGDNCKIQNNVSLYKGVTLEDGVFCGPSCVFTNVNNPRAEIERKDEFRPTLVKRGASIGARMDEAIRRVVDHGKYILGPEVGELERQLAKFCGAKHVLSCANGTDALGLALMAKGLKAGQGVIAPSFTFAATAEVIAWFGATPIFVDVTEDSFNMDPASFEAGIATARRLGADPVGVIPVDLFGQPAAYDEILEIAKANGLWVLCDAAQSFGAVYKGSRVGTFGDLTTTSFFPAKPLGCYGDGGAIFLDDDETMGVLKSLRVHGQGNDKYDNVRIGMNARLDTIQAAILIEKLAIFADEIVARDRVAARYAELLTDIVKVPQVAKGSTSVWAQYTVRLPGGCDREAVAARLKSDGVPTAVYYAKPLHLQTAYRDYPVAGNGLPVSERLAGEVLSLPMHPYLDEGTQDRVVESLRAAL